MSQGLGQWVDEVCADLHQESPRGRPGPFGIVLVLVVLASLALAARGPTGDLLVQLEEEAATTPEEAFEEELQAALLLEAEGRFREKWAALRRLHDRSPRNARVNLELAAFHLELTLGGRVDNHDFADEYLRLVEEAGAGGARADAYRCQLHLLRMEQLHEDAWKPGRTRGQAIEMLEEAAREGNLARTKLPAEGQSVPGVDLARLREKLQREGQLIRYKKARKLVEGGTRENFRQARVLFEGLVAEGLPEDGLGREVREALATVKGLIEASGKSEWRSG